MLINIVSPVIKIGEREAAFQGVCEANATVIESYLTDSHKSVCCVRLHGKHITTEKHDSCIFQKFHKARLQSDDILC